MQNSVTPAASPALRELRERLDEVSYPDQRRLRRRLDGVRRVRDAEAQQTALAEIAAEVGRRRGAAGRPARRRPGDHLPGGAAGQPARRTTSPPRSATTRS